MNFLTLTQMKVVWWNFKYFSSFWQTFPIEVCHVRL